MCLNDADGMANSVDPEQSDLGLHCLPRHICPKLSYLCVLTQQSIWFFAAYMGQVMRKRLMSYANNKGPDQPAHPCSLISSFVVCCLDSMICIVTCYIQYLRILASFCS